MTSIPQKILYNYQNNKLDREKTISRLIDFIEKSLDLSSRIESINILRNLGFKDNRLFIFFENLMISDLNDTIRTLSVQIIKENYLEKAFEPMCWAYKHEKSIKCLLYIISTLGEMGDPLVHQYLIKQIKSIKFPEFRRYVLEIIENNEIQHFTNRELAEMLKNYHIIKAFKDKYKRIEYKIKDGYLRELDLSCISNNIFNWNVITQFPYIISFLTKLQKLNLKVNKLKKLPNVIQNLSNLKELDLSNNHLNYLPNSLFEINSLEHLNLSHNNLNKLPDTVEGLKNLSSLNLSHNRIRTLPQTIGNLKNLKSINLHGNNLDDIDPNLFMLDSLVRLELGLNNIKSIHNNIKSLRNLEKLGLGGNKINKETLFQLKFLINLKILDLYDNKLVTLPDSISHMLQLTWLSLHNNQLKSLPDSFIELKSLRKLDLSWNDFTQIPLEIFQLKKLKILNLSGNKIHFVSPLIRNLKELKKLNLSYNKIHGNPEPLNELKRRGIYIQT
jgi:Leucine-rich repeat (LRR) protein